jgi:hypothetical protein
MLRRAALPKKSLYAGRFGALRDAEVNEDEFLNAAR